MLPDAVELRTLRSLAQDMEKLYGQSPELANELSKDFSLPESTTPSELAAWTVVMNTLYNLDVTKNKE